MQPGPGEPDPEDAVAEFQPESWSSRAQDHVDNADQKARTTLQTRENMAAEATRARRKSLRSRRG